MYKVNDIYNVTMSIEIIGIPDDVTTINYEDYEKKYSITYYFNNGIGSCDFTIPAGCISTFNDDIEEFIQDNMQEVYPEITKYEIFDVKNDNIEYQKAKVKVLEVVEE